MVDRIKLMIPIFHTKFDPLQLLVLSVCKIPPTGDFGDFWRFLVATFSNFIRMKLVIPIFHTEFDPLQVLFYALWLNSFYLQAKSKLMTT